MGRRNEQKVAEIAKTEILQHVEFDEFDQVVRALGYVFASFATFCSKK
jgi:hypothetical protein